MARGDHYPHRFVRLGRTSQRLKMLGLGPADLMMSAAKIVRAMREHPEVAMEVWERLPHLLDTAVAGFPSQRGDGSIIVVIVERDNRGDPIYGRSPSGRLTGDEWVEAQISHARRSGAAHFVERSFADAEPKPEPASLDDATSWSPGSIPVDRPARPKRDILRVSPKSNDDR